mgnify:CR=1 FL=1
MKGTRLVLLAFVSLTLVFLSACKEEEPEEELSLFIGDYVITKACLLYTSDAADDYLTV